MDHETPLTPPPADAPDALRPLDPRYRDCERIGSRITVAVLGLGGLVVWTWGWFDHWAADRVWWAALAALPLVLVILYRLSLWYTELELKHTRWRRTSEAMEIRRGVLWRRQIHVPRRRIQHTDVAQGPLQRRFGIATLTMHTAGTQDASVELSGLRHDVALANRDELLRGDAPPAASPDPWLQSLWDLPATGGDGMVGGGVGGGGIGSSNGNSSGNSNSNSNSNGNSGGGDGGSNGDGGMSDGVEAEPPRGG